jgi:multidrug efflux pump subunit AcrA (membrane-fusion protein)
MWGTKGTDVSEETNKLRQDLRILEAMAAEMDEYLRNDNLFWPLGDSSLPRLTLGGYLMRQHRLDALRQQLDQADQDRLDAAEAQFNAALVEKVVAFEKRAHEDIRARLRQWNEYLKDLRDPSLAAGDYYSSAVETRAMLAALLNMLEQPPYQLDRRVLNELASFDRVLTNYWESGDFIWPEEWASAYPRQRYWWLYGRPRTRGHES